jgi:hypothetical protein
VHNTPTDPDYAIANGNTICAKQATRSVRERNVQETPHQVTGTSAGTRLFNYFAE